MTTQIDPENPARMIMFGWSVEPNARRYHQLSPNSVRHYSVCRQWAIDQISAHHEEIPPHLTACPRCFPPPKTP